MHTRPHRYLAVAALALLLTAFASADSRASVAGSLSLSYDASLPGGGLIVQGGGLAGRYDLVVDNSVSIEITSIPPGATVVKAWLYWVIMGGVDGLARLNGSMVVAEKTDTGGDTGWDSDFSTAHRADVTTRVTGNGTYVVESLPSTTDPAGPDTDGVALLVIYKDDTSPNMHRVIVHDGLLTTTGDDTVSGVFENVTSPGDVPGRLTFVVGDGKPNAFGDGSIDFDDRSGEFVDFGWSYGGLWDIFSFPVLVWGASPNPNWEKSGGHIAPDSLAFAVAALDYYEGYCGDAYRTGTEECDDGDTASTDDCCTAECTFVPAATPCDNGDVCGGDTCDGASVCTAGTDPSACDDDNPCTLNVCDNVCIYDPQPDPDCAAGERSQLLVSGLAATLKWKLSGGPELQQADLGSPESTTPYSLCVYDTSAGETSLPMQLDIAPGPGWASADPRGYAYNDPSGVLDGLLKARVKTGAAGKSKLLFVAKGDNLPLPLPFSDDEFFDADPSVVIQLRSDATPACWGSELTTANKNVLGMYLGRVR